MHQCRGSAHRARCSYLPALVGASDLHREGIDGHGFGVAVIDTGIWANKGKSQYIREHVYGMERIVAQYDTLSGGELDKKFNSDGNGHGSHITNLMVSSRYKESEFNGVAPNADLIPVRAFDADGQGTYADVIRGIDRVVNNKRVYNIRVLNLSFSAEPDPSTGMTRCTKR